MKTLSQAIGYRLGQAAAKARTILDLVGGGEAESLAAEIRFGRELAGAVLERVPLAAENHVTRFAVDIGHWLAGHLHEKHVPFTVYVTAEPESHALALPGGHVLVSAPLLDLCQGERDEIAFVLGHAMAHVVRRHTLDRIVQDSVLSLLLRQLSGPRALSAWLARVGGQTLSRACTREIEREADAFAESLLRTCGGDATAGERLRTKLAGRSICGPGHEGPQPGSIPALGVS